MALAKDWFIETFDSLIEKEITIFFDNGDDIRGKLRGASFDKDCLILSANDGKKAIVYLKNVNMILEAPVNL